MRWIAADSGSKGPRRYSLAGVTSCWKRVSGMGGAQDGRIVGREGELGGRMEVKSFLREEVGSLVRGVSVDWVWTWIWIWLFCLGQ